MNRRSFLRSAIAAAVAASLPPGIAQPAIKDKWYHIAVVREAADINVLVDKMPVICEHPPCELLSNGRLSFDFSSIIQDRGFLLSDLRIVTNNKIPPLEPPPPDAAANRFTDSDLLTLTDNVDLGTADFTMEAWVRPAK